MGAWVCVHCGGDVTWRGVWSLKHCRSPQNLPPPCPWVRESPSSPPCQVLISCPAPGIILTEFTLLKIKPGEEALFRQILLQPRGHGRNDFLELEKKNGLGMKYKWPLKESPCLTGSGEVAGLELLVKASQQQTSLPGSAFSDVTAGVSVEIGKCYNSGNVRHLRAQPWARAMANSSRDGRGWTEIQSWDKANKSPSSLPSLFY